MLLPLQPSKIAANTTTTQVGAEAHRTRRFVTRNATKHRAMPNTLAATAPQFCIPQRQVVGTVPEFAVVITLTVALTEEAVVKSAV